MTYVDPAEHSPAHQPPADLDTCAREPIHIPGAIQPHGVLLALEEPTLRIVMASANAGALLGVPADAVIGVPVADLLGEDLGSRAVDHADAVRGEPLSVRLPSVPLDPTDAGSLRGRWVEVAIHRSGKRIVVEIEAVAPDSVMLSYQSARSAMARLVAARTVPDLADRLAQEIRAVTGFDRVMVYRFDADWNGEVIAEDRREDLNPFLGLHYPATDIPAQARRLYTVNWIRLIADIAYRPVPMVPVLDPATEQPLDLSFSSLRSVSPIHVEYLSNMGVSASMSVSLIVDGQLWGLIACHHYSGPHRPSHEARAASEFLGQIASQMMAERERGDQREETLRGQTLLTELTTAMSGSGADLMAILAEHPATLGMLEAQGWAVCHRDRLWTAGRVPSPRTIARIVELVGGGPDSVSCSHHLAMLDETLADHACVAAGALIVVAGHDLWFAWFRPEMPRVVEWGGDPANTKLYSGEGPDVRLSPRKSFDAWQELVRQQSIPWRACDLHLAQALSSHVAGLLLDRTREQIAVTESLQRTVVTDVVREIGGLEVVSRYVPASEVQLGGDWWDCVDLGDGRVAFTIGDVAGHGVEAVATMTQIRTALRAYLFAGQEPARSLDVLDAMMVELLEDQVASALVVVVDTASGEIAMVNAGHPAPLIVGAGPAFHLEGISRPILGVGAGRSRSFVGHLPPGATLLAYTDGLHERRDRDLKVTSEELRRAADPGPGAAGPARRILEWMDRLPDSIPGPSGDDLTMLAVRRPCADHDLSSRSATDSRCSPQELVGAASGGDPLPS